MTSAEDFTVYKATLRWVLPTTTSDDDAQAAYNVIAAFMHDYETDVRRFLHDKLRTRVFYGASHDANCVQDLLDLDQLKVEIEWTAGG